MGKSVGTTWSEGDLITTDVSGNILVSGTYYDSINFGTASLYYFGEAFYLVKYDSLGNALWAKSSGSIGLNRLTGLAADVEGNIYLCGRLDSVLAFGDTTISSTSYNLFLIKCDTLGKILWTNSGDGGVSDAVAITADNYNNVYITGFFATPYIKLGNTVLITNTNEGTMFITKFSDRVLGIQKLENDKNNILLYPNPVCNTINMIFNNITILKNITIYDILGRQVYSNNIYNIEYKYYNLKIPFLEDGIYTIRIISKKETESKTFIIKH